MGKVITREMELVSRAGVEPAASGLGGQPSIQLRYRDKKWSANQELNLNLRFRKPAFDPLNYWQKVMGWRYGRN